MKNLILGAAAIALAVACGGGKTQLVDAGVDAQFACDPIAQTGCKATEKCTWFVDFDADLSKNTEEIGHIGCAPASANDTGDGLACTDARMGTNNGVDTCAKGDLCIAGKCKPICDPQVSGSAAAGACKTNYACTLYAGVFSMSSAPAIAGVCEPACDPLTQQLKVGSGNLEACGAMDPAMPDSTTGTGGTCVFGPDPATWICAPTGPRLYTNTDRVDPLLNPMMEAYPNGCAPGFVPLFLDMAGGTKTKCTGICAPMSSDMTKPDGHQGDATVPVKLVGEATSMAGNGVCAEGKKGSTQPPPGEDCRFAWWVLFGDDLSKVPASPYNDTVGFCLPYQLFTTVMSKPADPAPQPLKSCADLPPPPGTAGDPQRNAAIMGCYPTTEARQALQANPLTEARHTAPIARRPYGPVPLARHVFE
jgi:hypothetical protein